MSYKRVYVDSLNLSAVQMESIFIYHSDYTIEAVKTKSVFKPKVWSVAFGRALKQNIVEAKIIHTYLGLTLPLKIFAVTPKSQTVEFAGLQGYNERSRLLMQTLSELKSLLKYARVMRIDIAIDFKGRIPNKVINTLSKHRKPSKYRNTTYYKTANEKKVNSVMDIKIYDKKHQAKLNYDLMRLEFCFKPAYFKKIQFKDIESLFPRMEKTIKRYTGLNVKIESI